MNSFTHPVSASPIRIPIRNQGSAHYLIRSPKRRSAPVHQKLLHRNEGYKGVYLLAYTMQSRNQDSSFSFFGFRQLIAAPIATPTAIQTGSSVAAKTATPIAAQTPIQSPTVSEFFNFLLILNSQL